MEIFDYVEYSFWQRLYESARLSNLLTLTFYYVSIFIFTSLLPQAHTLPARGRVLRCQAVNKWRNIVAR
jgi:hypothetical protein